MAKTPKTPKPPTNPEPTPKKIEPAGQPATAADLSAGQAAGESPASAPADPVQNFEPGRVRLLGAEEYQVVGGILLDNLTIRVNELLADGWTPLGGISAVLHGDRPTFLQALIRHPQ